MEFISFQDYLFEKEIAKLQKEANQYDYKKELVIALAESNTLDVQIQFVFENAIEHTLYDQLWEGNISQEFFDEYLNEGKFAEWIADKGKKAADKIKQKASDAKEKTTQVAAKLLKSFSTFGNFILDAIKKFLNSAWTYLKDKVNTKYNKVKDKVANAAAKKLSKKGDTLSDETGNLGTMCVSGVKFCTAGAVKGIGGAIKKAGAEEANESNMWDYLINQAIVECIKEDGVEFINEVNEFNEFEVNYLYEGGKEDTIKIPGLSKLVKKLGHLPFFKQLHEIGGKAEKFSNAALDKASYILNKVAGAPGPFKFVVIGSIVGLTVGYLAEHKIHHAVEHLIHELGHKGAVAVIAASIPILGFVINLAFKVATGLWYYETGQAIAGIIKGEYDDLKAAFKGTEGSASKLEDKAEKEEDTDKDEKKEEK